MFLFPIIAAAGIGYAAYGAYESMPELPDPGDFATWMRDQAWSILRVVVLVGVCGVLAMMLMAYVWMEFLGNTGKNSLAGSVVDAVKSLGTSILGIIGDILGPLLKLVGLVL